ncbi:distal tail protein Dit, partial [Clostridium botulinum]
KSSLYFNYAGRDSLEFNIINGSVDNAELKENFLANKKIKEINTIEADKPYFQGIERNPLQLKLQFCFTEKWNKELIREVARWLHQDNYQPLYFSEDPEKIYYAMPVDDVEMTHFGLEQGYLDITMRCNTYHAYSREYLSETYDLSENNEDGTEIIIPNYGDIDIKPDI